MGGQEVLLAAAGLHRRGLRFLRGGATSFPLERGHILGGRYKCSNQVCRRRTIIQEEGTPGRKGTKTLAESDISFPIFFSYRSNGGKGRIVFTIPKRPPE